MGRLIAGFLVIAAVGLTVAAEPAVVPWRDAAQHVGAYVTVEGDVIAVRIEGDICTFEFSADDPNAFRAAMVIPMISALPPHPESVYTGRRVHVTGTIRRFKGRTEMVLETPGQIEIVDHAGAPIGTSTTTTTTTTTLPRPAAAGPAPTLPPLPPAPPSVAPMPSAAAPTPQPRIAAPATTPPTTVPVAVTTTTLLPRIDPCPAAHQEWRRARDTVRTTMRQLDDCLRDERPRCRQEAAALAPALSALEWAEQSLADACP